MIALFLNQQLPGIRHKAATHINELAGRPLVDIPCQWATRHVRLENTDFLTAHWYPIHQIPLVARLWPMAIRHLPWYRPTGTKRPHRNGIGDTPTALNDRSVLNELSVNDVSNVVSENICVDTVMTEALEMGNDDTIVNEPNDFISDLKKLQYCNPKNMIIGHININSLRNKYDPIRSILQNGVCDIFTLSETKLDESFPTAQFHITNFVLHRKDRNAHGGGVITYIRSDLPHRRRYDMELNASGFEFIILEVQLYKKEKWLICSCYKPPSIKDSVFERSFSELLNS